MLIIVLGRDLHNLLSLFADDFDRVTVAVNDVPGSSLEILTLRAPSG
jgi:hypothetical protein